MYKNEESDKYVISKFEKHFQKTLQSVRETIEDKDQNDKSEFNYD